jgi:hypothetical protein
MRMRRYFVDGARSRIARIVDPTANLLGFLVP